MHLGGAASARRDVGHANFEVGGRQLLDETSQRRGARVVESTDTAEVDDDLVQVGMLGQLLADEAVDLGHGSDGQQGGEGDVVPARKTTGWTTGGLEVNGNRISGPRDYCPLRTDWRRMTLWP